MRSAARLWALLGRRGSSMRRYAEASISHAMQPPMTLPSPSIQPLPVNAWPARAGTIALAALLGLALPGDTADTCCGMAGRTGDGLAATASRDLHAVAGRSCPMADGPSVASAAVPQAPIVVLIGFGLAAVAFRSAHRRLSAAARPGPRRPGATARRAAVPPQAS